MPFVLSDSTAGTQRLAIDNSANVELGTSTPSAALTVAGKSTLSGSDLAQQIASPPAMTRVTGSVSANNFGTVSVSCGTVAGFGTASGGKISSFDSSLNSFNLYGFETFTTTVNYGVF